jgi:protoporphyrinogen oxidase
MIEQPLITVDQFEGHAYSSSQASELALNGAILRAEIGRSYEEFLEIFEKFYADDVEVSSAESREAIRGKERVLSFLANFLTLLHVMVEVAGLSVSVQQTAVPRDTANETHSAWRLDIAGVGGKRCTLKWYAVRRWKGARVVYEHHYDHQQIGGPLTLEDLNSDLPGSYGEVRLPS